MFDPSLKSQSSSLCHKIIFSSLLTYFWRHFKSNCSEIWHELSFRCLGTLSKFHLLAPYGFWVIHQNVRKIPYFRRYTAFIHMLYECLVAHEFYQPIYMLRYDYPLLKLLRFLLCSSINIFLLLQRFDWQLVQKMSIVF